MVGVEGWRHGQKTIRSSYGRLNLLLTCRGHLFELFDGLSRLLIALLEVRAVDFGEMCHELTLATETLLCRAPIHECLVQLLVHIVAFSFAFKLANQGILLLLVQLYDRVWLLRGKYEL